MKILSRILDRLNILCVRFGDGDEPGFSLATYTFSKGKTVRTEVRPFADPAKEKSALEKNPLVAVVSGKGVITKDVSAGGIVETITSDPKTFLWTVSGDKISFARRARTKAVSELLGKAGIHPLYIECLPSDGEERLAEVAERFASEHLGWRQLLKPSAGGSRLASFVAGRLMLPVLGVLLAILVVNFLLLPRVNDSFQEANAQLTALRKTFSEDATTDARRQAVIEEFSHRLPLGTAAISDMIGAAVPENIVLSEFAIAPVLKSLETGKPVVQNGNAIVIGGQTTASEAITGFTTALTELRLGTVRLESLEQDKERSVLIFRIEITL